MSEHMVMWKLGPVQPFIAAARKTQDLWVGSFLFSLLSRTAIEAAQKAGAEIVYPTIPTPSSLTDPPAMVPNTFVALCKDADKVRQAIAEAEQALYTYWQRLCDQIWGNLTKHHATFTDINTQWHDHTDPRKVFEITWVAVPIEADHYGATFTALQAAFAARKRLNAFPQQLHEGEKSTISGEQAALQVGGSSRKAIGALWARVGKYYGAKFVRTDGSERLGAIDVVKRLAAAGDDGPLRQSDVVFGHSLAFNRFPSTSTIAAAPFMMTVLDQLSLALEHQICAWHAAIQSLGIANESDTIALPCVTQRNVQGTARLLAKQDGDTLFSSTYEPKRIERDFGASVTKDQCQRAEQHLRTLITTTRDLAHGQNSGVSIPPPSPYFAVLKMDGDKMGDLISRISAKAQHQSFSTALSHFAHDQAPNIIETGRYPARLVYAGGDDVLALVPFRSLLSIAEDLRTCYEQELAGMSAQLGMPIHASTGICVAHHLDPLSRTLRTTNAAEHAAKNHYKRNSLVVTLLRRSGEHTSVGAPWTYSRPDGTTASTVALLLSVLEHFEYSRLSPKFAYLVADMAPTMAVLPPAAQIAEIRRLICRQRQNDHVIPQTDADSLAQQLIAFGESIEAHVTDNSALLPLELRDAGPRRGIVEVGGWLSLLAFMARGGRA